MKKFLLTLSSVSLVFSLVFANSLTMVEKVTIVASEANEEVEAILREGRKKLDELKNTYQFMLSGGNNGYF